MHLTRSGLALLSVAIIPATLQGQVADSALGDTLLVHSVLLPGTITDSIPMTFHRHGQYRVALWPGTASLVVASVRPHGRRAFQVRVREGDGVRPAIIEFYPYDTGPHIIRLAAALPGDTVKFWLWADRAQEARYLARKEREWGIGLALSAGYHTGYRTSPGDPAEPSGGSADIEGGLLVGSSGRLSALLGFGYQPRSPNDYTVTWFFVEPRVRLTERSLARHEIGVNLSLRIGQGASTSYSADPSVVAPGLVVTYALDKRPGARGWRLSAQALHAFLGNLSSGASRSFNELTFGLSWLP